MPSTACPALPSDDTIVFPCRHRRSQRARSSPAAVACCVTAFGDNVRSAQKRAYEAVDQIHFDGMQCRRRDIGYRAVARKRLGPCCICASNTAPTWLTLDPAGGCWQPPPGLVDSGFLIRLTPSRPA